MSKRVADSRKSLPEVINRRRPIVLNLALEGKSAPEIADMMPELGFSACTAGTITNDLTRMRNLGQISDADWEAIQQHRAAKRASHRKKLKKINGRMPIATPPPKKVKPTTGKPLTNCPRCKSLLLTRYDEQICMPCGFTNDMPMPTARKTTIAQGATYQLRYAGHHPAMQETVLTVRVLPMAEKESVAHFFAVCPFDEQPMLIQHQHKTLKRDGSQKTAENTYSCPQKHTVTIIEDMDGFTSWR